MIKIKFQIPKQKINKPDYEEQATFSAFGQLVGKMKQAGLQPIKFFGQVSPFLVYFGNNSFIAQSGDKYTQEGGIWKKSGKEKSMKELLELPETMPHPANPGHQIEVMKIFPSAIGMPKSIDSLVAALMEVSHEFEKVDLKKYEQTDRDVWDGPLSNPQALAYFVGKHHSKFALYIGSNDYLIENDLKEVGLKKISSTLPPLQSPRLELTIKTDYGDNFTTDKPGPTLMSVSKHVGPLGKVINETIIQDIGISSVQSDIPFTEIPLVKGILETGLPDQEERRKYLVG